MALDVDRIKKLAREDNEDLPPITSEQAEATVRLMAIDPGSGSWADAV